VFSVISVISVVNDSGSLTTKHTEGTENWWEGQVSDMSGVVVA